MEVVGSPGDFASNSLLRSAPTPGDWFTEGIYHGDMKDTEEADAGLHIGAAGRGYSGINIMYSEAETVASI